MIPNPNIPYHIVSLHSGKALAVADSSLADGGQIYQRTPYDADEQKWYLIADAAGFYEIMAVHSGKCLEAKEEDSYDGAPVHQWEHHPGDRQKWQLVEKADSIFQLVSKGRNYSVEVAQMSQEDGAAVQIETVYSGKYLEIKEEDRCDGAPVHQWSHRPSDRQKWQLVEKADSIFQLVSKRGNHSVEVAQMSQEDGAAVQMRTAHGGKSQQWRIQPSVEIVVPLQRFKGRLESTIDAKFAEIMISKGEQAKVLNYADAVSLTAAVKNIFKNKLQLVPPQIEAACHMSEALVAPSLQEKTALIQTAVGIGGGAAGIGMVIAGVGSALQFGSGVTAAIVTFFTGTALAGPLGWIVGGVTVAGIAGYFACASNAETTTEHFMNALKGGLANAMDIVWQSYSEQLSQD